MKLSVIIVNYNVRYYVEQCIISVQKATKDIDCEIIVVDNHSSDGSVDYLAKRFASEITLIDNNHNLGFAKANNIAIRQSAGEYVLLLNPDTFVGERSIAQVLEFMDAHPKAGGAGVMMHNSDGSIARESRRGLPTPYVSLLKMLGFPKRYYMSHLSWDCPGQIDVVSGAFFMLRREALDKAGLLDEDFFMYGEDIDLSYRLVKAGYENWYVPARIVHYKGESTQKTSFRYVHVFYQAMLIFFRKHYGHLSLLVTLPIKLAIYFRALLALIQMMTTRMRQYLGFRDTSGDDPLYALVGSDKMKNDCMSIIKKKGLTTVQQTDDKKNITLIFDTGTMSYEDIIDSASKNAGCQIGTYHQDGRIIITQKEVFL